MKHCRKAPLEPECLTKYRKLHSSSTWDDFRHHEKAKCYGEVRDSLWSSQGCLCAYCEIRLEREPGSIPNEQIAHFHPKSDQVSGYNWALDWSNLWVACLGGTRSTDRRDGTDATEYGLPENRSCDEATEDKVLDGMILRPDEIPAFPRLFRYAQLPDRLDIKADADLCEKAEIPVERVEQTIEELNLNCRRLAEARLRAILAR